MKPGGPAAPVVYAASSGESLLFVRVSWERCLDEATLGAGAFDFERWRVHAPVLVLRAGLPLAGDVRLRSGESEADPRRCSSASSSSWESVTFGLPFAFAR